MSANSRSRAALAIILVALALPARAALFDDDEARKRIADTNVRLTQVQSQLEARIAALEQQLKAQGLVEMLGISGLGVSRIRTIRSSPGWGCASTPTRRGSRRTARPGSWYCTSTAR